MPGPLKDHNVWDENLVALRRSLAEVNEVAVPLDIWPDLRLEPAVRLNDPFNLTEVEVCLEALNTGRVSGLPGLPAELFRVPRFLPLTGSPAYHLLAPCLKGFLHTMFTAAKILGHSNLVTISFVSV